MVTVNIKEKEWLEGVYDRICAKMDATVERNRHKIPYTAENGVFNDMSEKDPTWWTNGFWGGILWQLYHARERSCTGKRQRSWRTSWISVS